MYDIIKEIKCLFDTNEISFVEFGKNFKVNFITKRLPNVNDLKIFINSVVERDKIKITFINLDEENIIIKKDDLEKFDINYEEFLNNLQNDDDVKCLIEIEKIFEDGHFSIYNWEKFYSYLNEKNIIEILDSFNYLFNNKKFIFFEVLDKDIYWSTKTIIFSSNKNGIFKPLVDRESIIKNIKEVSYFYNDLNIKLIPDDFIINNDYKNNLLTEKFGKLATLLSISYISNQANLIGNNFQCKIIGQRNIDYNYDVNNIKINLELIRIYEWIYSNDNAIDKTIISRNIISLHCKFCDLLNIDEKTFSSIQSNYRIYLKDNVSKFLEAKETVSKFICDITLQISSNASKMLNDFKTNIFAIFGFLLTVVITNISSEQPLDNIFTNDVLELLWFILYGSIFYFIICLLECLYKYKKIKLAYSNLKDSYKDIFTEEDFKNIFESDKKFEKAKKSFLYGILILSLIWIIVLALSFCKIYTI